MNENMYSEFDGFKKVDDDVNIYEYISILDLLNTTKSRNSN